MGDEKKTEEQLFYLPPPQLSKWESFKLFMWNSERQEFMGRTASSWGKVGLFYLVFYAGLAAFFALLLAIFYQTLSNTEPKWKLDSSLIGNNPGLGFRPMPPEENIDSTLIWFRHGEQGNWNFWADSLKNFMAPYEDGRQDGEHYIDCVGLTETPKDKVCRVDINKIHQSQCLPAFQYGYQTGQPCVAIKLNRIFDWVPEPYNLTDLPSDAPDDIRKAMSKHPGETGVWISCEGENAADKENLGEVKYYPFQVIPKRYFPFRNTPGYLSPMVMVHFTSIEVGVLINVECRAWAKNINYSRSERKGSVHLEIMVD